MVEYTKTQLPYWNSFFQDEVSNDSTNETLKSILNTISDPFKFKSNRNAQDFGPDLDATITSHYFNPSERKHLRQYSAIRELEKSSNELLCEWSIYCGLQLEI
ncbi:hypothetical protein RCL_jg24528.t1 [Rhizophagus clarus]|uniref:Uncharacterized protein n=1 Tax=Rhizophagus clarus TaxID=94130 RepID=A0A8H3MBK5_9GLOM|nr:hypothetical protein RCL_jg24528.t1 [Rhizophagus clarus]